MTPSNKSLIFRLYTAHKHANVILSTRQSLHIHIPFFFCLALINLWRGAPEKELDPKRGLSFFVSIICSLKREYVSWIPLRLSHFSLMILGNVPLDFLRSSLVSDMNIYHDFLNCHWWSGIMSSSFLPNDFWNSSSAILTSSLTSTWPKNT